MNRKKAGVGLSILVFIGALLITALYIAQQDWFQRISETEKEVELFVNLDDGTAGAVSFLKSKTRATSYFDSLVCELESVPGCTSEEEISEIAKKMDISIELHDGDGNVKKRYGERKLGQIVYVQIPLPSGKSSVIGIVTDLETISIIG